MTALERPAVDDTALYPLSELDAYEITVLTKKTQIDTLEPEWNSFLAEVGIENISLRFEWVQAFLSHFPQEKLCIIVLRDADRRLVALAPFAINHGNIRFSQRLLRYVRFLGSKEFLYDWMQLPVRKDVSPEAAIKLIIQALFERKQEWDVLDFQSYLNLGDLQAFSEQLKTYGGHFEIEPGEAMPKMALPQSLESYESNRSKKRVNRDTKRFTKKLEEHIPGKVTLRSFQPEDGPADDLKHELHSFCKQHEAYWLQRSGTSNFKTYPQLEAFYRHLLTVCDKQSGTPYLAFSGLSINGTPLSYQLGIWHTWGYMNYMNNYNQEYKAYRPGILHMDAMVRESIAQNGTCFSFGQGEEGYKDLWADSRDALWHFRYFKNPLAHQIWKLDLRLKKIQQLFKNLKSNSPNQSD